MLSILAMWKWNKVSVCAAKWNPSSFKCDRNTPQWPYYWWCSCALAQVSVSISFQFKVFNWRLLQNGPMDCNVICIKRPNIRGRDAASNEVGARRQRLCYCELVASIHLSPPQSRHCDRARCFKIPREGLCLLYGFVLVCGDTECLHTVGLAQGSFISRINDSFFCGSSPQG